MLGGAAALALPAHSQPGTWPTGAVRITLAYPPGGVSDTVLRDVGARLASRLGVPVLIDHQPGAGGALALRALGRAKADGQSLCFCAISPLTVQPHLSATHADLPALVAPVVAVMATPVLVVGTSALAGGAFDAVLTQAQDAQRPVRWATSGMATTGHLVLEHVRLATGGHFVHVPYKGGGPQISAAAAGQFEVLSSNVAATQIELVRSGRLSALAVGAPARLPVLPQAPTMAELGFPAANLGSVFGLFAPADTPAALLDRIQGQVAAVLEEPALRSRLLASGNLPRGEARGAFVQEIRDASQRHGPLIRAAREHFP
jgi:tripartite-type tricarboxylate transporter receptor subunit TctC